MTNFGFPEGNIFQSTLSVRRATAKIPHGTIRDTDFNPRSP